MVAHLRFDVVLSRYGIWNGVQILFGVLDGIQDITRSSGMVWRIRFIYRKSLSKFGNDPVHLWKVEASGINHYGRWSPGWTPPTLAGQPRGKVESMVDSPTLAGQGTRKGSNPT